MGRSQEISKKVVTVIFLGIMYYIYTKKADDLDVADLIVPDDESSEVRDGISDGVTIMCEGRDSYYYI